MKINSIYCMSDIHCHTYPQFESQLTTEIWGTYSSRLFFCLISMVNVFADALESQDNPVVVIPGDIFHIRGKIIVEVFNAVKKVLLWAIQQGVQVLVIPGNHDLAYRERPIHALEALKPIGVQVIETPKHLVQIGQITFVGLPYNTNEKILLRQMKWISQNTPSFSIGLFHCTIDGVAFESGYQAGSPISLKDFPKNLSLILNGHHHTPKKLSRHVLNVGALLPHSFSDANSRRGYWKIYCENLPFRLEFIQNDIVPQFLDVEKEENLGDISLNGNYVRVLQVDPVRVTDVEQMVLKAGALGVVTSSPLLVNSTSTEVERESLEFKPFDDLFSLFENYMVLKQVKPKKRQRLLTIMEKLK